MIKKGDIVRLKLDGKPSKTLYVVEKLHKFDHVQVCSADIDRTVKHMSICLHKSGIIEGLSIRAIQKDR